MKKEAVIGISFVFVLILMSGFVSASWLSDFWGKITGRAVTEGIMIEKDIITSFGTLKFNGAGTKPYCEFMGLERGERVDAIGNCDMYTARYFGEGVESVEVNIEIRKEPFDGNIAVASIAKSLAQQEGMVNSIDRVDRNVYYALQKTSQTDGLEYIYVLWTSQDKVIGIPIGGWNRSVFDDDIFEDLLRDYLALYPSDLTSPEYIDPIIIYEQVKCVFANSSITEKCYGNYGNSEFTCSGVGSCAADVSGGRGQEVTWTSSCSSKSLTTTIDGLNEYARFMCSYSPKITDVKEQVTCVFENSTTNQNCYTKDAISGRKFECSGVESCVVNLYGQNGRQLAWKSSCGAYPYVTTIDGVNEKIKFKCAEMPPTPEPIITPNATATNCTDSDGGQNINIKGTTCLGGRCVIDECVDSNKVKESSCFDTQTPSGVVIVNANIPCSSGEICSNGACVIPQPSSIEIDFRTVSAYYMPRDRVKLVGSSSERAVSGSVLGSISGMAVKEDDGRFEGANVLESADSLDDIPLPVLPEKYDGYIIELEEKPIVEKLNELKAEAKKNDERLEAISSYNPSKYLLKPFLIESDEIEGKIKAHEKEVADEQENILGKISRKLNKPLTEDNSDEKVRVLGKFKNVFNGIALNISDEEAVKLKDIRGVKEVSPNYEVSISLLDSVPLINADDVWRLDSYKNNCAASGRECLTGKGVTIAIIDTGVDYTHPDLGGCFGAGCKVIGGWDFINNDTNPIDDHGHGTHVAATAAGNGGLKGGGLKGGGLNGVAPDANIIAYKVFDASGGRGYASTIIAAIERAVDPNQDGDFLDHVDVISMSLATTNCGAYITTISCSPDNIMAKAVDIAVDAGVTVVIAAGNTGPGGRTIGSPGVARKAITVGANKAIMTTNGAHVGDAVATFSSRGPIIWIGRDGNKKAIIKPDIIAPGVVICAAKSYRISEYYLRCLTGLHASYVVLSGTSMATPHVAGAVALLKQKNPNWTPDEIKMALRSTAIDINMPITAQGYGRIDVLRAVNFDKPLITKINTNEKAGRMINITGTANGEDFNRYTLSYGTEESLDAEWTELTSSTTPVENDTLLTNFDSYLLNRDKIYYLRLVVWNNDGKMSEDRSFIEVNDIAKIKNPSSTLIQGYLTMKVQINVNATELPNWVDTNVVVDRMRLDIEANGTVDLSEIWDEAGGYAIQTYSIYRVYAKFEDLINGDTFVETSEFLGRQSF